jgi:hypothetical protein
MRRHNLHVIEIKLGFTHESANQNTIPDVWRECVPDKNVSLRLSVQTALLGLVTPKLRAVACGWQGDTIIIDFLFDGEFTAEEAEECRVASTEVVADYPKARLDERITAYPYPMPLGEKRLSHWVYIRKEP